MKVATLLFFIATSWINGSTLLPRDSRAGAFVSPRKISRSSNIVSLEFFGVAGEIRIPVRLLERALGTMEFVDKKRMASFCRSRASLPADIRNLSRPSDLHEICFSKNSVDLHALEGTLLLKLSSQQIESWLEMPENTFQLAQGPSKGRS